MFKERNKMYGHDAYGQIKNHFVICVFYCLWSFLAIILISGCNGNIPPASKAVSSKVTLSWNEIPGALSYNVYGSTSPRVTKLNGYKLSNVSNPFTSDQLQPGKTYYFVFTVITDSGESEESKEFSYTAVMDKVGFIDLKNLFDKPIKYKAVSSKVTLSWNEIPGALSYNVYGSTSPRVTKLNGYKLSNVSNPFTSDQLQIGKTYYFVFTVITDSGESEESKEFSYTAVMDKVGFIDLKNLFDKPIKYQESSTSEKGNVTLAWDNVPNATSYNIYWKDSPGVTKFSGKKISNVNNPHTIKGLKPGTFYIVVTAVNELGESVESAEFSISVD